jgi:zinc transporter ZupT
LHIAIWQVPVEQVAVAFAREHMTPHAPQWLSVLSACSQPLASFMSQLPYPALHVAIWQVPVEQVAVAFAREHMTPHAPQWLSVLSGCSHPLASFMSQLPYPALHVAIWQVPVEQVAVAFAREHMTPHPPQWLSVLSGCSHPLASFMSQLPYPALHIAIWQVPVEQVAVAFAREHMTPHAPQWLSVLSACSQPLASFMSQLPYPALQL